MFQLMDVDIIALMVKVFLVSIAVIYAIFSFMVVRQVSLMNRSFTTSLSGFFTFLSWIHFLVSLVALSIILFVF